VLVILHAVSPVHSLLIDLVGRVALFIDEQDWCSVYPRRVNPICSYVYYVVIYKPIG